jgi:CDP-diacylglycerol--inositol 3-phosphatidyltransferase
MKINPVFLFIPNLIGYFRVSLFIAALICHSLNHWLLCIILYSLNHVLDEFDGRAARKYNQNSQFGAALDMVTDRITTAGLCLILTHLYPAYTLIFILLISLDIGSHYYLLYATAMIGESSHKDSSNWSTNPLLNLYYSNKSFLDLLVIGNELFYILLYISFYATGLKFSLFNWDLSLWQSLTFLCLPLYILKQITNIIQLQVSAQKIAELDSIKGNS